MLVQGLRLILAQDDQKKNDLVYPRPCQDLATKIKLQPGISTTSGRA
jgi:hypothetical protein